MPARLLTRLSLATVVALSLMACGGDDSTDAGGTTTTAADGDGSTTTAGNAATEAKDAGERAYIDAAMDGYDPVAEDLAEDDARCIVTSVVTTLGVDRLQDLGISPEEFNDADVPPLEKDEAELVVGRMESCIDLHGLMLAGLTEDDSEVTPEGKACVEEAIDDDLAHDLMVASVSSEDAAGFSALLSEAIGDCPGFESLN